MPSPRLGPLAPPRPSSPSPPVHHFLYGTASQAHSILALPPSVGSCHDNFPQTLACIFLCGYLNAILARVLGLWVLCAFKLPLCVARTRSKHNCAQQYKPLQLYPDV